jgi:hypothetical protein
VELKVTFWLVEVIVLVPVKLTGLGNVRAFVFVVIFAPT